MFDIVFFIESIVYLKIEKNIHVGHVVFVLNYEERIYLMANTKKDMRISDLNKYCLKLHGRSLIGTLMMTSGLRMWMTVFRTTI